MARVKKTAETDSAITVEGVHKAFGKVKATAAVDGALAAEAELLFSLTT